MNRRQKHIYNRARNKGRVGFKAAFGVPTLGRLGRILDSLLSGFGLASGAAFVAAALLVIGAGIAAATPIPDMTQAGGWAVLATTTALSYLLLFGKGIYSAVFDPEITLPSDCEYRADMVLSNVHSIGEKSKNDLIKNDPDAMDLVKKAYAVYDDYVWSLHSLSEADPKGFPAAYVEARAGKSNDPYISRIREVLLMGQGLGKVDATLSSLISEQETAIALEARRKVVEERLGSDIQGGAITMANKEVLDDSLSKIKLREDIKKKSSRELEEYLDKLEIS